MYDVFTSYSMNIVTMPRNLDPNFYPQILYPQINQFEAVLALQTADQGSEFALILISVTCLYKNIYYLYEKYAQIAWLLPCQYLFVKSLGALPL